MVVSTVRMSGLKHSRLHFVCGLDASMVVSTLFVAWIEHGRIPLMHIVLAVIRVCTALHCIRYPTTMGGTSYIMAMGPLHPDYYGPDTTPAFWQMAFEASSPAIVMLAAVKKGYSGCSGYFPTAIGEVKMCGEWAVTAEAVVDEDPGNFLIRRMVIVRRVTHCAHQTLVPRFGCGGCCT
jgi:hypothetical protein